MERSMKRKLGGSTSPSSVSLTIVTGYFSWAAKSRSWQKWQALRSGSGTWARSQGHKFSRDQARPRPVQLQLQLQLRLRTYLGLNIMVIEMPLGGCFHAVLFSGGEGWFWMLLVSPAGFGCDSKNIR